MEKIKINENKWPMKVYLELKNKEKMDLDYIRTKHIISKYSKVFKIALRIWTFIEEQKDKGNSVYLEDKEGNKTRILDILF